MVEDRPDNGGQEMVEDRLDNGGQEMVEDRPDNIGQEMVEDRPDNGGQWAVGFKVIFLFKNSHQFFSFESSIQNSFMYSAWNCKTI